MKKKLKLTDFSISSFETSLTKSEAETIGGGDSAALCVSLLVVSAGIFSLARCPEIGTKLVPDRAPNDTDNDIKTQIHCTNLPGCTRMGCAHGA